MVLTRATIQNADWPLESFLGFEWNVNQIQLSYKYRTCPFPEWSNSVPKSNCLVIKWLTKA
jgi:hypothetical protein